MRLSLIRPGNFDGRIDGIWHSSVGPRKGRRYLWKPQHVARAIFYVLYRQGDIPDFDDE